MWKSFTDTIIISPASNMKKSKLLATITGGIFLADYIFSTEVAMAVILVAMGLATIYTTLKEK